MSNKAPSLRERLDPHDSLAELIITTRCEVLDPGMTACTMRDMATERVVGMVYASRYGTQSDMATFTISEIDVARGVDRRSVYFAAWLEMLALAHSEGRALVSKPNCSTHEEMAAWSWLEDAGEADIVVPFTPVQILGRQTVYYSGAALAMPPVAEA